ncbi:MAG: hypothetical protein M3160_09430 [Candidatus Eremiobacteraeota bacterium]|nr:hypothetical protein [Candidatus Eremiobacteraeota bacterium]
MHRPRERVTVNLSAEIADRIRAIRFDERLSASVVVEHALQMLLRGLSDHEIAERLRADGASLRRQNGEKPLSSYASNGAFE